MFTINSVAWKTRKLLYWILFFPIAAMVGLGLLLLLFLFMFSDTIGFFVGIGMALGVDKVVGQTNVSNVAIGFSILGMYLFFVALGFLFFYSERRKFSQEWSILEFLRHNQETETTKQVIMQQTIEPMINSFKDRNKAIRNFEEALKELIKNKEIRLRSKSTPNQEVYCLQTAREEATCMVCGSSFIWPKTGQRLEWGSKVKKSEIQAAYRIPSLKTGDVLWFCSKQCRNDYFHAALYAPEKETSTVVQVT